MKNYAYLAGAIVAGFAFGFLWGARTREGLPDATSSNFAGGVLTVRVDTVQALKSGLSSALGG